MKFFDLEMDTLVASGRNGGGRSVSFISGYDTSTQNCVQLKYTHGNNYQTCGMNSYKIGLFNQNCRTHYGTIDELENS